MAILPGSRIGPYEILSAIGACEMGEVCRARNTRPDPIVANKILPPLLADRSELRERFGREAKTIANLNHPHLRTLHDYSAKARKMSVRGLSFRMKPKLKTEIPSCRPHGPRGTRTTSPYLVLDILRISEEAHSANTPPKLGLSRGDCFFCRLAFRRQDLNSG
jgi:serine/threonine protein kinase